MGNLVKILKEPETKEEIEILMVELEELLDKYSDNLQMLVRENAAYKAEIESNKYI